jgi:hypothetical protein
MNIELGGNGLEGSAGVNKYQNLRQIPGNRFSGRIKDT